MKFQFTKEREAKLPNIFAKYPTKRAAMLPILWLVQEQEGWISEEAMQVVAAKLELAPGAVQEVVSFYTMFNRKPLGQHHIQVCNNFCCRLRGADWLVDYVKQKTGCKVGETSSDGRFHLSTVECLASCGTAPMMQINNDYYENLTPEKVDKILKDLT
ncbi:MAG: NADH-quinone oxidoreductase subunit NuoE [Deltaproteobacteria bacterium]|nr:NADH-quinone oxidoreductase subunit NuoE [Deltaproteobacteria bacterium]